MTQPSPAWRQVASMAFPRAHHNTTLLPDGTVLVTGGSTALDGYDVTKAVYEAELWSPETETWQTLARGTIPRLYHSTALLLPDARVLVAGSGNDGPGLANQTRGQVFSPPYFFKGPRPTITAAPATAQYGSTFTVATPDAASIAKISLIRPGAVTHSFDEDQRIVSLSFTAGPGSLSVQAPANANLAPPGYYMLFIVNTAGVPSVAKFVHLPVPAVDIDPPSAPTGVSAEGATRLRHRHVDGVDRQHRRGALQHSSIDDTRVPALGGQPRRTSHLDDVHEHGRRRGHLLLRGDRAGRRRQRERPVGRGVGVRVRRHDTADSGDHGAGR